MYAIFFDNDFRQFLFKQFLFVSCQTFLGKRRALFTSRAILMSRHNLLLYSHAARYLGLLWLTASCREGESRVEGVRVGSHCSGVKPLGCHDKLHHIAKPNVICSVRIACLWFVIVVVAADYEQSLFPLRDHAFEENEQTSERETACRVET